MSGTGGGRRGVIQAVSTSSRKSLHYNITAGISTDSLMGKYVGFGMN